MATIRLVPGCVVYRAACVCCDELCGCVVPGAQYVCCDDVPGCVVYRAACVCCDELLGCVVRGAPCLGGDVVCIVHGAPRMCCVELFVYGLHSEIPARGMTHGAGFNPVGRLELDVAHSVLARVAAGASSRGRLGKSEAKRS